MFAKLLGKPSIEAEKKKARLLFEKLKASKDASSLVRKAKIRAALMARNHIDLTFVDACKQTELFQAKSAQAASSGGERPPEPAVQEYQKVKTGEDGVWVFLPEELINDVFRAGVAYQSMNVDAAGAVVAVQSVLDRLVHDIFELDYDLTALGFLREEFDLPMS